MVRGLLIGAAAVDVGIAILLVGISGFIVGTGPQSMQAGAFGTSVLFAAVAGCLAAPAIGFAMQSFNRPAGGILVAWSPPAVGLLALSIPPNY